jgi:predicted protein tyrosine phosphatase
MAIIVCSLSRLPQVAETRKPARIVSLLDPLSPFPDASGLGIDRHLRLSVHDIAEELDGLTAPAAAHVQDVLAFVADWDRADPILVHCYAGISRSTATAYAIACALNPGFDEAEIAWSLRNASITAWPNRRIVAIADAELGRNGRMSRAIEAIGAGRKWEDVGEAQPFDIPSRYEGLNNP